MSYYTETFNNKGDLTEQYATVFKYVDDLGMDRFKNLNDYISKSLLNQGASYLVYNKENNPTANTLPFDLIPRVIDSKSWGNLERGLKQRNIALNLFLNDVYGDQKILKDKILPVDFVLGSNEYKKEMRNISPPGGIMCHICGTDIIRCGEDEFYILEDNLRNPSGVSYVLSNRNALKKIFGKLFQQAKVRGVGNYIQELLAMLRSVAPSNVDEPSFAILSPGSYNSAYFEHALLARNMGVMLVEGSDLFIDNNFVYAKTINGPKRIDVLYRRIDDDYLDPMVFNDKSLIGISGLMASYRAGNVTIVNAPGCGIADDKAIYTYIPEIIEYYLNEKPIVDNVKTYICSKAKDWKYVKDHLHELVIKPVNMSGGYGISIGSTKTKNELNVLRKKIELNPRNYIAQQIMKLSLHSTYIKESQQFEPRHVDLRTYSLLGKDNDCFVLPGGLSRVALQKDNLIVNSSQGGGSKDTWVLENEKICCQELRIIYFGWGDI